MERGEISKIREKPGESNAGKYKTKGPYAGPDKTFPINTMPRARNALARAHFAKNPESVKEKVYAKYPGLKERHEKRSESDRKKMDMYKKYDKKPK